MRSVVSLCVAICARWFAVIDAFRSSLLTTNNNNEPTQEFKSTAVLPYIKGVSEVLRRCLQQQGVCTVFKSDTTLRSYLVRPKDTRHI